MALHSLLIQQLIPFLLISVSGKILNRRGVYVAAAPSAPNHSQTGYAPKLEENQEHTCVSLKSFTPTQYTMAPRSRDLLAWGNERKDIRERSRGKHTPFGLARLTEMIRHLLSTYLPYVIYHTGEGNPCPQRAYTLTNVPL